MSGCGRGFKVIGLVFFSGGMLGEPRAATATLTAVEPEPGGGDTVTVVISGTMPSCCDPVSPICFYPRVTGVEDGLEIAIDVKLYPHPNAWVCPRYLVPYEVAYTFEADEDGPYAITVTDCIFISRTCEAAQSSIMEVTYPDDSVPVPVEAVTWGLLKTRY